MSVSNRAATSAGASQNASFAVGGFSPETTERTDGPNGTRGTPQQHREILVRRRAHQRLPAEFPHGDREPRQWFDVPA